MRWQHWRQPPVKVSPFPVGKDFAVTFVDDTDLSTLENTEPVYDFLWEHGVKGTKTVWVNRQQRTSDYRRDLEREVGPEAGSGATLEDPEYLAFVRKLADRGFEIALHCVAAGNSYRGEIERGLDKYRDWFGQYPRMNVFHERNIENLYAGYHKLNLWPFKWLERLAHRSEYLGHVEKSPYFWGDLAQERIVYMRVPFHTLRVVNTLGVNPSMPFRDARRPYVNYWFSNSDGSDCQRFNTLLSAANVAKLKRERGACLVYTHFAKGFARRRGGRYELDSGFVGVIRHLVSHKNAWFPTGSQFLDRLRAIRSIMVQQNGNEVVIANRGEQALLDVGLRVAPGVILESGDGLPCVASGEATFAIGNVDSSAPRRLRSNCYVPHYASRHSMDGIGWWERARLEVLNYIGMLRN